MQKITPITVFLCLFFSLQAIAQKTIDAILDLPVSDLPVLDTTLCKDCIYLRIPYGASDFSNLDVLKRFKGNDIHQVDMVFSIFSRTEGFDQAGLNRQRLVNLQKVAGELFEDASIDWTLLRQTNCRTLEETQHLFHGFVVHITPGKSARDKEGKLTPVIVDKPQQKKKDKTRAPIVTRDSTIREMVVTVRENIKRNCEPTGKFIPNNKAKAKKGIRYATKGKGRKPEKKCKDIDLGMIYDTAYVDRKIKINTATGKPIDASLIVDRRSDTTLLEVLDRNWDDWKKEKVIVVQDVTLSMSGYLTQILVWHELYSSKGVDQYVFFNDGDNKPGDKKVVGKTGGIYHIQSNRLQDIQSTARRAANAGTGGDVPENNIEAAIFAQNKCPDCTLMVMIADNFAPVKDFSLIKEVKKPIHVIVCGGNGEQIHSDYLSIAAITGGSVHTSKIDLDLAGKAVEDQVLTVGERTYTFSNGRFSLPKQ